MIIITDFPATSRSTATFITIEFSASSSNPLKLKIA